MEELGKNWITEGTIDFEYKKYIMLAYLQQIEKQFGSVRLFPAFSKLLEHYENLVQLKNNRDDLLHFFPKDITSMEYAELNFQLKKVYEDDELMRHVAAIIEYSIPHFKEKLDNGRDLFDFVESQLELDHVGVMPIYKREGYLMLHDEEGGDVLVYRYGSSLIETAHERYRSLKTEFVLRERKSISRTFEQIKLGLARRFKELPNPATWLVVSKLQFPLVETFLPVTKRLLIRHIEKAA